MVNPKCDECGFLRTKHKCVRCNKVNVCPECSDKRGYSDLSKIPCAACGPGPTSTTTRENAPAHDEEENPPPPPPDGNVVDAVATAVADDDDDEAGEVAEAVLMADTEEEINKDQPENPENSEQVEGRAVKEKPTRFNGKLGKNAEITAPLKSVLPLEPIRIKYHNTYKQKRCSFIVQDVREFQVGKGDKAEWKVFLVLKWKKEDEKPGGAVERKWKCNFRQCKLVRAGPPNQFFFAKAKKGGRLISPSAENDNLQPNDEVVVE